MGQFEINNLQNDKQEIFTQFNMEKEKKKMAVTEVARKEERVAGLKAELSDLQEHLGRMTSSGQNGVRENLLLKKECNALKEKVEKLESELNLVCTDSNELHNEGKAVVDSFNKWLRQQQKSDKSEQDTQNEKQQP